MENLTPIQLLLLATYGSFVSLVEERIGKFQDLPPAWKETLNGVFTLVIPYALAFISQSFPNLTNPEQLFSEVWKLLIPAIPFVLSLLTHNVEKIAQNTKKLG